MGKSNLQAGKKQSFSLPSFRRSSAGDQRQEVARNADEAARSAEEAARVQKAAAWQWYTRGVHEAVALTKRPPVGNLLIPPARVLNIDKSAIDGRSKECEATLHDSNVLQKKPLASPLAESPRSASRFKAEAGLTARPSTSSGAAPTPPGPSVASSTPLYDELELSGLRTQMASFMLRLQHQSPAVADHRLPIPAATSVLSDRQQTKAPPSVAAAYTSIGDHQLTSLPPSAAPVASRIPFHMRPFSAIHRLLRKVVSGSIIKIGTRSSAPVINSSPAVDHETEVLPSEDDIDDYTSQYHYHHYIHHHHHHYHYAQSPEERAATIRSLRRHSESSGIRPPIPGQWVAESDEDDDEAEESPIAAYLGRRRRYSDSFAGQLHRKKAGFDEDEGMNEESAKAGRMQLARQYDSKRLSPSEIPTVVSKEIARSAAEISKYVGFDGGRNVDMRSRRRHSAESYRDEGSLERTPEGGGKSGGGTYKLSRGAAPGKPVVRRRHSEVGTERTPPPGRLYWRSPSARRSVDLVERHSIGVPAPSNATPFRPPAVPRVYPQ